MKYIEIESLIAEVRKRHRECLHAALGEDYNDFCLGEAAAYREMAVFLEVVANRNPGDNIEIII